MAFHAQSVTSITRFSFYFMSRILWTDLGEGPYQVGKHSETVQSCRCQGELAWVPQVEAKGLRGGLFLQLFSILLW